MSLLRVQNIEILTSGKAGVPIGHPYIQLPGMPDPDEIYTGTWENVSADYEGDFFRVEGGEALAFDPLNLTEQLHQMQRITGTLHPGVGNSNARLRIGSGTGVFTYNTRSQSSLLQNTSYSNNDYLDNVTFNSADSPDARTSSTTDGETFPTNRTIRIWKRVS